MKKLTRAMQIGGFAAAALLWGLTAVAEVIAIPDPIAEEHAELHARLQTAANVGGETGRAAAAVIETLGPHFEKEERYALPQLGALPTLVGEPLAGAATLTEEQKQDLRERSERLRAELPQMLEEHEAIHEALERLHAAAVREQQPEQARLAEEIQRHAQTEEAVLYPAALLVGELVSKRGEDP
ncbi:MAG: hypothetical protein ACNA7W_17535 [Pseudomonadales bacterium]